MVSEKEFNKLDLSNLINSEMYYKYIKLRERKLKSTDEYIKEYKLNPLYKCEIDLKQKLDAVKRFQYSVEMFNKNVSFNNNIQILPLSNDVSNFRIIFEPNANEKMVDEINNYLLYIAKGDENKIIKNSYNYFKFFKRTNYLLYRTIYNRDEILGESYMYTSKNHNPLHYLEISKALDVYVKENKNNVNR